MLMMSLDKHASMAKIQEMLRKRKAEVEASSIEGEEWLPINKSTYDFVSNLGRIRSYPKIKRSKDGSKMMFYGGIAHTFPDAFGVRYASTLENGDVDVGREVAIAFLSNGRKFIRLKHKDGVLSNNAADNLDCTFEDSKHNGTVVRCVNTGKVYDTMKEASWDYGISRSSVSKSVKTHRPVKGFLFEIVS